MHSNKSYTTLTIFSMMATLFWPPTVVYRVYMVYRVYIVYDIYRN